jgi:hypothetical protein
MAKPKDKQPWFKFYPQDWRGDAKLRMCSIAARGLWAEMLCVMHEADPYGHLMIEGKPVVNRQIASLAGISVSECGKLMCELESAGVYSRTDDKIIFSRRMVRDREKAEKDRENGKGGGNPKITEADKGRVNPQDKAQKPEARDQSQNQKAAAAAELDEVGRKAETALRAIFTAIRIAKTWSLPNMDHVRVWLSEGIAQGTINSAAAPILKRKEDMASLAYCDSAVREAHAVAGQLRVVSSNVWVDEGTPEWACWQREYRGGRGSPVTEEKDPDGHRTGRRGWYFETKVPPGYDEVLCEKIPTTSEEDAA